MARSWRSIGRSGSFPEWLRDLADRSGVYAIRSASSGEVLYVGESHTDRLYGTITRHFQNWEGYTAGTTYQRGSIELAVETSSRDAAARKQLDWIDDLKPRDNSYGVDDEEIDPDDFRD